MSHRPIATQAFLDLLDFNWRQAEVGDVCLKVHLRLAVFGPSEQKGMGHGGQRQS